MEKGGSRPVQLTGSGAAVSPGCCEKTHVEDGKFTNGMRELKSYQRFFTSKGFW